MLGSSGIANRIGICGNMPGQGDWKVGQSIVWLWCDVLLRLNTLWLFEFILWKGIHIWDLSFPLHSYTVTSDGQHHHIGNSEKSQRVSRCHRQSLDFPQEWSRPISIQEKHKRGRKRKLFWPPSLSSFSTIAEKSQVDDKAILFFCSGQSPLPYIVYIEYTMEGKKGILHSQTDMCRDKKEKE